MGGGRHLPSTTILSWAVISLINNTVEILNGPLRSVRFEIFFARRFNVERRRDAVTVIGIALDSDAVNFDGVLEFVSDPVQSFTGDTVWSPNRFWIVVESVAWWISWCISGASISFTWISGKCFSCISVIKKLKRFDQVNKRDGFRITDTPVWVTSVSERTFVSAEAAWWVTFVFSLSSEFLADLSSSFSVSFVGVPFPWFTISWFEWASPGNDDLVWKGLWVLIEA